MTFNLRAQQGAAGAPIQASIAFVSSDPDNDSYPYWFLAVTATSAVPSTRADLLAVERMEQSTANTDVGSKQANYSWAGGVMTAGRESQNASLLKRLDATYVAGRYLWAVGFDNNPPQSGDPIVLHSGPYLIR